MVLRDQVSGYDVFGVILKVVKGENVLKEICGMIIDSEECQAIMIR